MPGRALRVPAERRRAGGSSSRAASLQVPPSMLSSSLHAFPSRHSRLPGAARRAEAPYVAGVPRFSLFQACSAALGSGGRERLLTSCPRPGLTAAGVGSLPGRPHPGGLSCRTEKPAVGRPDLGVTSDPPEPVDQPSSGRTARNWTQVSSSCWMSVCQRHAHGSADLSAEAPGCGECLGSARPLLAETCW